MRSMKMVAILAVLACTVAYGQSYIVYTLETGGSNNTTQWEAFANPMPAFVSGVTDGTTTVEQNKDLTWAIRVSVGGTHTGTTGSAGNGKAPNGAANLVFDLEVYDSAGQLVTFGAAPMACSVGTPYVGSALKCEPTAAGFWSSINDGDIDGVRPTGIDKWANAAFAIAIYNTATAPTQQRALNDVAPNGPYFDYGWYPTAKGRSGIAITGGTPRTDITTDALNGRLVGFGAGYKSYDYTNYRPGVGKNKMSISVYGFGANIGSNPQVPTAAERPLFEGQINTKGLALGTYYIKVVPSQTGNNILHGDVSWNSLTPNYGGFGSFAVKANNTVMVSSQATLPIGVPFVVTQPAEVTEIVARKVFYNNSWFDQNNAGLNPTGTRNDNTAIDTGGVVAGVTFPEKTPLMAGGGLAGFANYTNYTKGINGLMYDVHVKPGDRDPIQSDFTFTDLTRTGTGAGIARSANNFGVTVLQASPRVVRCTLTFADATILNTWLKVDIGTGFGAPAETHYWINAAGDVGAGNSPATNLLVGPPDELAVRSHPTTALNRSKVWDPYDVNKTSLADPSDQLYIRSHTKTSLNCVKLISK